jgi:hypothetical protein
MSRRALIVAFVLLLLAAVGIWWATRPTPPPPAPPAAEMPPTAVSPMAETPASAASAALAAASAAPETAPPPAGVEPLPADDASVQHALVDLLGKPAVLQWMQTDGFADRVVATVDNLGRGFAAPRVWPVVPSTGRFTVIDGHLIAAGNSERYGAFVKQVEAVDPAAAALLYRRMLPQLQAAYEAQGYPGQRFDARLRAVVDELLATPERPDPIEVTLTEVKGPVASERPWVRYEFADPALEALPAGQKIMLRIGADNRHRLQDWLRRFRAELSRR